MPTSPGRKSRGPLRKGPQASVGLSFRRLRNQPTIATRCTVSGNALSWRSNLIAYPVSSCLPKAHRPAEGFVQRDHPYISLNNVCASHHVLRQRSQTEALHKRCSRYSFPMSNRDRRCCSRRSRGAAPGAGGCLCTALHQYGHTEFTKLFRPAYCPSASLRHLLNKSVLGSVSSNGTYEGLVKT